MKNRTIVGLLIIVLVASTAVFSGCVEERSPPPTPVSELTPIPTAEEFNVTIDSAVGSVMYLSKSDDVSFFVLYTVTNHEDRVTPADLRAQIYVTQQHYGLDLSENYELGKIEPHETKQFSKIISGGYSDYKDYNPFKYTNLKVSVYVPSKFSDGYSHIIKHGRTFDTEYEVIDSAI